MPPIEHTPGPLDACPECGNSELILNSENGDIYEATCKACRYHWRPDMRVTASAVAPELLACLKEAITDIFSLCDVIETVPGAKPNAFRKGVAIYLEAIAKAEGRS